MASCRRFLPIQSGSRHRTFGRRSFRPRSARPDLSADCSPSPGFPPPPACLPVRASETPQGRRGEAPNPEIVRGFAHRCGSGWVDDGHRGVRENLHARSARATARMPPRRRQPRRMPGPHRSRTPESRRIVPGPARWPVAARGAWLRWSRHPEATAQAVVGLIPHIKLGLYYIDITMEPRAASPACSTTSPHRSASQRAPNR